MQVLQRGTWLLLTEAEQRVMKEHHWTPTLESVGKDGAALLKCSSTTQAEWWQRKIEQALKEVPDG